MSYNMRHKGNTIFKNVHRSMIRKCKFYTEIEERHMEHL